MNKNTESSKLAEIRELITEITSGDRGVVIYLKNVVYSEGYRSSMGNYSISISCVFIDDNDVICADMYRTGNGGFFEFICGKAIDDLGNRGLDDVAYALGHGSWSVSEQVRPHKRVKHRIPLVPFRMPFHLKGA